MTEIQLTLNQMKAFGVKPNEIGFKQCKPNTPSPNDSILNRSFGSVTPPFQMSYSSDLDRHSSLNSTHLSLANTTGLSSAWNCSQMDSSLNTTSTSWEYNRNTNLNTSVNSPDQLNDSNSGYIRLRRNQNRIGYQSSVTNQTQLNNYLKDFEIKEQKQEELVDSEKRRQSNASNNAWNSPVANNPSEDSNQNTYQIAIDSPLRLNSCDFDSVNTSATFSKAMDSVIITKIKTNYIWK